jgi:hypothetical protein
MRPTLNDLAKGTYAIALLGQTPACGLGGHEGFGQQEEKVAIARDDEVKHGGDSEWKFG